MSLRLYDTRTRTTRPFEPLVPGCVSIYVCGPTVQAAPHIGHLRGPVAFDVLRRWLLANDLDVIFARNVTDIDDKILTAAAAEGIPWWALSERSHRAFASAYDAVRVLPPTVEPRATGHVPQMIELIAALVAAGHAYPSGDGDVWFDVRSAPGYGALSGQSVDALRASPTVDEGAKRDRLDFALWKGAKPGEPFWETPWGRGRPGWHLECSAMAAAYLGPEFDLHGGGLDLVFPHHENEVAQSESAGHPFARWWLHHGLITVGGEKMSKSLGNSVLVADLLAAHRPVVLRYHLLAPHYRSLMVHTAASLSESAAAYGRLETFVRNATEALGGLGESEALALGGDDDDGGGGGAPWKAFGDALDDDLGVPQALAVVHSAVRAGNVLLSARTDRSQLAAMVAVVRRMLAVLGLDPVSQWGLPQAGAPGGARLEPVVDVLVGLALAARAAARARKDYAEADAIRDRLTAAGLVVEDTAEGARWRLVEH